MNQSSAVHIDTHSYRNVNRTPKRLNIHLYVTLDHKTSPLLVFIYINSQKYIVWVKIIILQKLLGY